MAVLFILYLLGRLVWGVIVAAAWLFVAAIYLSALLLAGMVALVRRKAA